MYNAENEETFETQERDFERNPQTPGAIVGEISTKKRHHDALILDGVASRCVHCSLALTDSVSIEASMGHRCRGHGYNATPENPDEIQALIDLAEYPELVDFLVENYKPKGIRGLMNGIVKVAALNKKSPVFSACCSAVDSLGYRKLAATLRSSLAVVEVRKYKNDPNYVSVWVRRNVWNYQWSRALENIYGTKKNPTGKGMLVLIVDGKAFTSLENDEKVYNKDLLWKLIFQNFKNYVVKIDDGAYKISQENLIK